MNSARMCRACFTCPSVAYPLGASWNKCKHVQTLKTHLKKKKTRQLTSKALALLQRKTGGALNGTRRQDDYRSVGVYFLRHPPGKATCWNNIGMIYDCEEPTQAIYNDLLFQGGYLEPELRQSSSVQRHWVKGNLSISSWRLYDKNILLPTLKTGSTNSWFVGTMQW